MKDNFDLKKFLVENKLTESSRGNEDRTHFGKTLLNEHVRLDESVTDDWNPDEKQRQYDRDYEAERRFAAGIDDVNEAVNFDDEEDDFDDPFDAAVRAAERDPRARKAAERGMRGTELDADAPDYDYSFEDPEDMNDEDDISTGDFEAGEAGDFDMSIFGRNQNKVEPLVDLAEFFNAHKNYNPRKLVAAVNVAAAELRDFDYPRSGVLYLIPQAIGYRSTALRSEGETHGVVAVHRDPIQ